MVDVIALAAVVAAAVRGYFRGLSGELALLLSSVAAFAFGLYTFKPVAAWLQSHTQLGDEPDVARALAFVGAVLVASVAMVILRGVLGRIMSIAIEAKADRRWGVGAGLAKSCVVVLIVYLVMNLVPHDYLNRVFGKESVIGRHAVKLLPRIENEFEPVKKWKRELEERRTPEKGPAEEPGRGSV